MQRRLTIALVTTAGAAVFLVGLAVLGFWRLGAQARAEEDVIRRIEAVGDALEQRDRGGSRPGRSVRPGFDPRRLRDGLGLDRLELVAVGSTGYVVVIDAFEPGDPGAGDAPDDADELMISQDLVEDLEQGRTVTITLDASVVALRAADVGIERSDRTVAVLARQGYDSLPLEAAAWFALSSLLVMAGAVVAGRLLARRLTTPLRHMQDTTARLASGDLRARVVKVTGADETAELGRSVNAMAAELERSKALDQQFLLSVSHDLRTPLTAIAGYAEALSDGTTDDPSGVGSIIGAHADRLERLVADLLDLARLDANRFSFDPVDVDLSVLVGRTMAGFEPRSDAVGVTLGSERQPDVRVFADPARVEQVVANLLDNALKFARSAVEVTVSEENRRARIVVADDGPGVAEEDLPHVFDRLYRARHQPVRAENPTGLGLAIVRDLTRAMGGTVEVDNAAGSGARFTVELPTHHDVVSG